MIIMGDMSWQFDASTQNTHLRGLIARFIYFVLGVNTNNPIALYPEISMSAGGLPLRIVFERAVG